jgi:hypothetical protein
MKPEIVKVESASTKAFGLNHGATLMTGSTDATLTLNQGVRDLDAADWDEGRCIFRCILW